MQAASIERRQQAAGTPRPAPLLPDPDLARVLRLAQQVLPGLRGEQDPDLLAGALRADGVDADAALRALCQHWKNAYPEAGSHYLALRCWGLAIWQPVYLMVIAVHLATCVPRLTGMAQPVEEGYPRGFRVPPHAPVGGALDERMTHAAEELKVFCSRMRSALAPHVMLHDRAAAALQAECVLGALLAMQPHHPALPPGGIEQWGRDWLARLGIEGGCGFFAYRARDGTPAHALERTVCCHFFRRRDGDKCSTCPKLPLDARIALLRAEV